jgi:hypothetical protein
VGLSGAWAADKHDIVGIRHELAAMELSHEGFVDLAAGEVEAGQVAIDGEAGCLELIGGGSDLPSCDRIGMAASKAGAACSVSSATACAMPCIFRLRSMMTMAPLAGS